RAQATLASSEDVRSTPEHGSDSNDADVETGPGPGQSLETRRTRKITHRPALQLDRADDTEDQRPKRQLRGETPEKRRFPSSPFRDHERRCRQDQRERRPPEQLHLVLPVGTL